MSLFKKKSYKFKTDKEKKLSDIVAAFCSNKNATVSYEYDGTCYMSLKDDHYDIVVSDYRVVVANTNVICSEQYAPAFITHLRSIVKRRVDEDNNLTMKNIQQRENDLLNRIFEAVS